MSAPSVLSDIPDQDKSQAVFDTIISFETRLALCDRLMAFEDADEVEAEMWSRMSAKLLKKYKKRHELAHFSIVPFYNGKAAISPFFTGDKFRTETARYLTIDQIKERSRDFIDLHMAVFWFKNKAFFRRFPKARADQGRATPEPDLVQRLRELAIQNLAKQQQPGPTGAA